MRAHGLMICAMLALSGCDMDQGMAVSKGQDMVASVLKDSDSAKFSGAFLKEDKSIGDTHYGRLCGAVNSKNSFGGYSGERRFSANISYSKQGSISVSDVQLEEGINAHDSGDGRTFFQKYYWSGVCDLGELAATSASQANTGKWSIQIASLSSTSKAFAVERELQSAGVNAYRSEKDGVIRVFAGPFDDRNVAEARRESLEKKQKLKGIVVLQDK